jgi:hypothetical protein
MGTYTNKIARMSSECEYFAANFRLGIKWHTKRGIQPSDQNSGQKKATTNGQSTQINVGSESTKPIICPGIELDLRVLNGIWWNYVKIDH